MGKKKRTTKKKVDKKALKALVAVAEDFNSFMFEEDEGIDLDLDYDELLAEVADSAGDLTKDDVISADSAETLEELEIEHKSAIEEDEDAGAEEEEEEEEEEAGAEEEAEEEEEEEAEVEYEEPRKVTKELKTAKSAKLAGLKDLAKENSIRIPPPFLKDVKKLRPYIIKRLKMIQDGEVVKKGTAAKKKTGPKMTSGYCREFTYFEALVAGPKKGMSFDEVIEAANDIYVDNGGKENLKQSAHAGKTILKVLVAAEAVTVKGDKYKVA